MADLDDLDSKLSTIQYAVMGVEAALQDTNKHLEEVVKLLKGLVADAGRLENGVLLRRSFFLLHFGTKISTFYHGEGSGGF
jgi:hypothetical protein